MIREQHRDMMVVIIASCHPDLCMSVLHAIGLNYKRKTSPLSLVGAVHLTRVYRLLGQVGIGGRL